MVLLMKRKPHLTGWKSPGVSIERERERERIKKTLQEKAHEKIFFI